MAFNRTVNDREDSTHPGDRAKVGNPNGTNWPAAYPPTDISSRMQVQTYILAGQHFMNFCDGLKHLVSALPGIDTTKQYQKVYDAVAGMVSNQSAFPTYFLKPSMVALIELAAVHLVVDGNLPDPSKSAPFSVSLKSTALQPLRALAGGLSD